MNTLSRRLSSAAALVLATLLAILLTGAPTAQAAGNTGLFGSADPTYDGVYRQALSILALDAAGRPVPRAAVDWLSGQQCADGSFQAYRANTAQPCAAPDPVSFSGPDSNSTALAAAALAAVGRTKAAQRAVAVLLAKQNPDGGWGYTLGSTSDSNSTALVIAALDEAAIPVGAKRRAAVRALAGLATACADGASALAYQPGSLANGLATAQGLAGVVDALEMQALESEPGARSALAATCRSPLDARLAGHLANAITAGKGLIRSDLDPTAPDANTTAWAVLALAKAGRAPAQVRIATSALKQQAATFVRTDGVTQPAAAAMLALVAVATGNSPRAFGGQDTIALILGSMQ